jgi:hypothetical protein
VPAFAPWRPDNGDQAAVQQTVGDRAPLAIILPVVEDIGRGTGENAYGIREVQAPVLDCPCPLLRVVADLHPVKSLNL